MNKKLLFSSLLAFVALLLVSANLNAQCTAGQSSVTLTLDLTNDAFPDESGWKLVNITDGTTVDSSCFQVYTAGVYQVTFCADTSKRYGLIAMDDYGDGLDGGIYSLAYTYGGPIASIGTGTLSIPVVHCGGIYSNNEIEDTVSFRAMYVAPPSCLYPINLVADSIGTDSALLFWTELNSSTNWQIQYGPAGTTLGNGTIVSTSNNPFNLNGLNSSTKYVWWVRTICGAGDTSSWSTSNLFTTKIQAAQGVTCTTGAATAVFTEEFTAIGAWTGDWLTSNRAWRINSGGTTSSNTGPSAAHSGTTYAYFESSVNGTDTIGAIISPAIDLSNGNGAAELSFWMHAYGGSIGTLTVGAGTSATGPFTPLFASTGQIQSIDTDPFINVGVDLSAYVGQVIYLEFSYVHPSQTGFTGDLAIDLVEVTSCVVPPSPVYPIYAVNTVDNVGSPDSLGVVCWVSGTVAGIDLDGNAGLSFTLVTMNGATQEGINIFNFVDVSNYVVTEGDSIKAHGTIDFYNGLLELLVDSISIISTGNTLPAHRLVTTLDESTESNLIEMRNLVVTVAPTGSSVNYTLSDGTNTFTMRVDSDTDIHDSTRFVVGDTICSVKGIGGQFDNSSPYFDGYQIFPMRFADIDTCVTVGITEKAKSSNWTIYPNPSNGEFNITSSGFENDLTLIKVTDISGRVVNSMSINNSRSQFTKSIDLGKQAKGLYFIIIKNGEKQFIEKMIIR